MVKSIRTTASSIILGSALVAAAPAAGQSWDLANQVEIRRTDYGVPHVRAESLRGAAFGLAYAEAQDYGAPVFEALVRARGHLGLLLGTEEAAESDFVRTLTYERARETYSRLDRDVREMLEGFAEGVNHYLALHPEEAPQGVTLDFSGVDVHALTIGWYDPEEAERFVRQSVDPESLGLRESHALLDVPSEVDPHSLGSNAWALAPSRTRSGHAILVRNPHLSWDAGYYEAHLTVPGVLDFYGDFRIGGLFGIIGGFNPFLGWSTTNNYPDLWEVYALRKDDSEADRFLLDRASHPVRNELVTVGFRDTINGEITERTRTHRTTHVGPVVFEDDAHLYVVRHANHGEYRRGEQFLQMMRATELESWLDAMRERRISSSNYTYADREGNIYYVWNAKLPKLPHPWVDAPVPATGQDDLWTELVPFDSLPQLLNPSGGYVRNENDPPYHTNLFEVLDREAYPENMPAPRLRLRSQHSLELLHNDRRLTLEEVVELKHSPRMVLADRVKEALVAAVRLGDASEAARDAADLLRRWDNTASSESRGSVLFKSWFERYRETTDSTQVFRDDWTSERPLRTPFGLGSSAAALAALEWAIDDTVRRYGRWDVAWGEVHRVRHGSVDVPVSGCNGALGCFRVLWFSEDDDGRFRVRGGDGWVLAVEFADVPRAFSVLAYGQSGRDTSEHHDDQAALFAAGSMKPVYFTPEDVDRATRAAYTPGREGR
jgi:acyl-homoserine-lactone acylase